jgi:ribosome-associated heat shock protein Hsp15
MAVEVPLLAVRVDRWLVAARAYKTRGLAQRACEGGRVKLNGSNVKSSHFVKCGDEVRAETPHGQLVWIVRELAEKRLGAPAAKLLYEDKSPPPVPKEERPIALRDRGTGRPTKAERRAIDRLLGES